MVSPTRWHLLLDQFRIDGQCRETYSALLKAYQQKHRHYHNLQHISDCLTHLDIVREQCNFPAETELALWFHDAIYRTRSTTNERDSAKWADNFLRAGGIEEEIRQRVFSYIMATCHQVPVGENDAKLIADIDLAILGQPAARYDQFEKQIRREYRWVPRPLFRRKRREVLQSFLERDSIYSTDFFVNRYENPARGNLRRAISDLSH